MSGIDVGLGSDRGQAHTLEAFTGALLLIGSIIFALQVTAVTPLTASTSSQHIENQQLQVARGLLDSAVENGSLGEAVRNWNDSAGSFANASDEGYYVTGGPTGTTFGAMLNRTFIDRGVAVNVNVLYVTTADDLRSQPMVDLGTPSDNAVAVSRTITLYDNETLADGATTLNASSSFFAPDVDSDTDLYNVVRVEVIVWRM